MTGRRQAGRALTTAVLLAVAADVLMSTALGLARGDLIGDLGADADQYAGLSGVFAGARIFSFAAIPWAVGRLGPRSALRICTSVSAALAALATLANGLMTHIILQALIGFVGGGVIVAGQTLLLCALPRRTQPMVQALFAIAVAAGPAALSPAASGWLLDLLDWRAIYGLAVLLGVLSLLAQSATRLGEGLAARRAPFDPATLLLLAIAAGGMVHAHGRGQRAGDVLPGARLDGSRPRARDHHHGGQPKQHEAHVTHAGVTNDVFQITLGHCRQCSVDNVHCPESD